MHSSNTRREWLFWILQLGGWGAMHLFPVLVLKDASTEFMIFNFLAGTTIGVAATTPLRYYLRRHILFDSFGWKEVIRILGALVVGSFMLGLGSFLVGLLYVHFFPVEDEFIKMIIKTYDSLSLLILNSVFLVFLWLACYLVIKLMLKLNKDRLERSELNSSLRQAQLNTLKGQINPHFMFNSLNNIRGLMLEDVERSREMLTKLSEMLRYSLTQNNINAIALESELEIVDHFIDLSRIQFEERLEFTKEIDPASRKLEIPPMIIQLLVENAVKHGISRQPAGGKVFLKTQLTETALQIEVRNTGTLQIQKGTTQLGLKNIRQRLGLLYGTAARFSLEEANGEVIATIRIPVA